MHNTRVTDDRPGRRRACGDSRDHDRSGRVARDVPRVVRRVSLAQSRSLAPLVHGFATFDPSVRLGGVIVNRVASDRHERLLRDALAGADLPVYGVIRRTEGIITPSRHLGLIPAAERALFASQMDLLVRYSMPVRARNGA